MLTGAVSAVNVSMTNNSKVIHEPFSGDWPGMCEDPLTCFSDDFSASTLGSDWVVAQRNGSTLPPSSKRPTRHDPKYPTRPPLRPSSGSSPGPATWSLSSSIGYATRPPVAAGRTDGGGALRCDDVTPSPAPSVALWNGFKTEQRFCRRLDGVGIDEYGNYANEGGVNIIPVKQSSAFPFGFRYQRDLGLSLSGGTASNLSPTVDSGQWQSPPPLPMTIDSRTAGQSWSGGEHGGGTC